MNLNMSTNQQLPNKFDVAENPITDILSGCIHLVYSPSIDTGCKKLKVRIYELFIIPVLYIHANCIFPGFWSVK